MADLEVLVEGNKRIVRATVRVPDEAGVLTNPTTSTFTARKRGAVAQTFVLGTNAEVTNPSTGVIELNFEPAEGTWAVYFKGTGAAHVAGEIQFIVARSEALV